MKNNNKSPYTLKTLSKILKQISKHADLHNPEKVKEYIANKNMCDASKLNYCSYYNMYCKFYKIKWEMPKYRATAKHIKIPTSEKLEQIIASSGKTLATKLKLSKETGMRPIEVCTLKVKDVDLEQKLVRPTTAKNGNPRTLRISENLRRQIENHIVRNNLKLNDKLFNGTATTYTTCYIRHRKVIANRLKDPTLLQIRLYDFRHYFATMLYHKTKDILFVKQQMGHKSIDTTLTYTQLLSREQSDKYKCRVAQNVKQATELIENGFEYVTEMDGLGLFRKRK
jgi:integrase